jgi:5-methylcytosine-specific restriction endonuclease McrA
MLKFSELDLRQFGDTVQLVGGVWADDGNAYVLYFPEYVRDAFEFVDVAMDHDAWKALLRQTDLVETEVLAKAKNGELFTAILRKCERQISQQVSWNVFRRDGYRCRYCGNDKVPLTVDHAILWQKGGPSIEDNLVTSCKKCNKIRGQTPYVEWLQHKYYLDVYRNLTPEVRYQNEMLVDKLTKIPTMLHVRER